MQAHPYGMDRHIQSLKFNRTLFPTEKMTSRRDGSFGKTNKVIAFTHPIGMYQIEQNNK